MLIQEINVYDQGNGTNFINESGLLHFVLEPTQQSNVLDLLLTNDSNLISSLLVECPFSTSDHNVYVSVSV